MKDKKLYLSEEIVEQIIRCLLDEIERAKNKDYNVAEQSTISGAEDYLCSMCRGTTFSANDSGHCLKCGGLI